MKALGRKVAILLAAGLLGCAGCSFHPSHMNEVTDGGQFDVITPADARVDANPAAVHNAMEIVSGGGHLTGGSMTLDVQVGHPMGQGQATGGTKTIEGGAVVKP